MMLGSKMGRSGVSRQSSRERHKGLTAYENGRARKPMAHTRTDDRTNLMGGINRCLFRRICFLVLRSASRTLPGLVAKAKGLVSRQEFAASPEKARPLRQLQANRALERTHYSVSGISVSSV